MIYTYKYDANYDPAFPVVEIDVWGMKAQQLLSLKALVDSGSDATMIPLSFLQQTGAMKSGRQYMRGIAGGSYLVDMYLTHIRLGSYEVYIPVIADRHNDQVIVGRDVLNHMIVKLNGLAHTVEVSQ